MNDYKITKIQKIFELDCDKCHNFYFLAYFRLYNKTKTKYKHGKFVLWFDAFEVQDYFEQDYYTKEDVKQLASELAVNTLESFYKSYENTSDLYSYCNKTIEDYNKIASAWSW